MQQGDVLPLERQQNRLVTGKGESEALKEVQKRWGGGKDRAERRAREKQFAIEQTAELLHEEERDSALFAEDMNIVPIVWRVCAKSDMDAFF